MTTQTTPDATPSSPQTNNRFVTPDETGLRLDRWFKRHFPHISHGQLQKWLRTGQVRLDGKRAESSDRLAEGQALRLPPPLFNDTALTNPAEGTRPTKGRPMRNAEKLKALVLYEDADVIALNKPAGLAVQGGTGLKENLDDSLMVFSADGTTRPKLVHRLDRDTSGVLLIAKNDYAAAKLAAAFRARTTQKIYWAATCGVPSPNQGRIDAAVYKKGQIMHVVADGDAEEDKDDYDAQESKSAHTLYQVVESVPGKMAFVALWPLTGRTHQLRVHLAHLGTPLWGDPLYGDQEGAAMLGLDGLDLGKGLHLHARRLVIPHPRKGVIDVTAPLPAAMRKTWRCFGFSEKAKVDFDGV